MVFQKKNSEKFNNCGVDGMSVCFICGCVGVCVRTNSTIDTMSHIMNNWLEVVNH